MGLVAVTPLQYDADGYRLDLSIKPVLHVGDEDAPASSKDKQEGTKEVKNGGKKEGELDESAEFEITRKEIETARRRATLDVGRGQRGREWR